MSDERKVTVKLVGAVPGVHDVPELWEHVGRYLVRYEPEKAHENEQWLWTTAKRNEALVLPFMEAMELVKKPVGIREHDGKLDRPITVFTLEFSRVSPGPVL